MNTFHGDHGLSGWQWLFLLEGIPSVIIGVLVLLWLDDRINKAKWLTANEKAVLIRNIAAEEQHKKIRRSAPRWPSRASGPWR